MKADATLPVLICLFLLLLATATPSGGACYDFEDETLDGWAQTNSGGAATFDVVEKNGSFRAHVGHVSNTTSGDESSLSKTFDYAPSDTVSFEMEALSFRSGSRPGLAGVRVSLLNSFNVPLGVAGLFNVTSSSLLGPNDSEISSTQESYSATMGEFAELAGLDDSDPIAKMSLSFIARGFFASGGGVVPNDRSGGNVWVDDVCVETGAQGATKFTVELPGEEVSGINGVGGWKCPQDGEITIIFDDHGPLVAAGDLPRNDTAGICENDGRNGFLAEYNYGLLGPGEHTVRFLDDGVEFARRTFSVGTLGAGFTPFAENLSGEFELPNFPQAGTFTILKWKEELQGFVILRTEDR